MNTKLLKTEKKMTKRDERNSTDFWYSRVINNITKENLNNDEIEIKMIKTLRDELPSLISAILERSCIFQCRHCVFQKECSSESISKKCGLDKIIFNIVKQIPSKKDSPRNPKEEPMFIHEGRILKEWHLDILKNIRLIRPDIKIGLIDNGSYTRLIPEFKKRNLRLDWLDISIDGIKEEHNIQRNNPQAFDIAYNGLKHAKEIVLPSSKGGRVTGLYTISTINYKSIKETAKFLFKENLIDEFHITTIAPMRAEHVSLETSSEHFKESWRQIKSVYKKLGISKNNRQRVFVRLYRHEDIEKLAKAVGIKKFIKAIMIDKINKNNPKVEASIGKITFYLDEVPITFSPLSTWPQETFLIDVDGANRLAHSLKYTLPQLQQGLGESKNYTVGQLNKKSNFIKFYQKTVDQWWAKLGKKYLQEEIEIFDRLKASATKAKD